MGEYLSATFLAPFAPTDIVLKFVNASGNRTFGINVCQYDKSSTEENELWIYVEDASPKILKFDSAIEAQAALATFRTAIDTLRPNCPFVGVIPAAPPQTINAITLTAYKAAQLASTLIPLQWYDIADTLSVFTLGPTIRVQAKSSNDFEPSGMSLTTNELVTINVIDDSISRREDTVVKTLAETQSFINNIGSTYIKASNFSTINATNSSNIEANNNSLLTVDTCTNVTAINGTILTLINGNNVFADNVNADFTLFAGLVNNIVINSTSSIGKLGRETMNTTDGEILYSYVNLVEQTTPTLIANISKVLANPAPTANAEFRVLVGSGLGTYTLTIQNSLLTPLFVISSALENTVVTFRWNKTTNLFEFVPNVQSENVLSLPVGVDGQTNFTGIAPSPTNPTSSTLIVNGDVQTYGALADYYIVGDTLFWTNNDFSLETVDEVILKYT